MTAFSLLVQLSCGADDAKEEEPIDLGFAPLEALATWPEVRNCRFSIEHDAIYVRVLVNPEAEGAYNNGVYPFAEGTVGLKALYDDDKCTELLGFATMRRLPDGERSEHADWEWWSLTAEGKPEETNVGRCVSCHQHCTKGRDLMCTDP